MSTHANSHFVTYADLPSKVEASDDANPHNPLAIDQPSTHFNSTKEVKKVINANMKMSSTVSQLNNGLTVFTVFPDLPPELRNMIWEHALPEGQYLDIRAKNRRLPWSKNKLVIYAIQKAPTIYFVSQEARAIVNKHYIRLKGHKGCRAVYSNVKKDIFCFLDEERAIFEAWLTVMGSEMVEKVENLLVENNILFMAVMYPHLVPEAIQSDDLLCLSGLKTLRVSHTAMFDDLNAFRKEIKDLLPTHPRVVDFVPNDATDDIVWENLKSCFEERRRRHDASREHPRGIELSRGVLQYSVKCKRRPISLRYGPIHYSDRHPWNSWIKTKVRCWELFKKGERLLRD